MPLFYTEDTISGRDVFYVIPLDSATGFYGALQTALALLADPGNWQQDGLITVQQAAQVCSAMFKDQFVMPDPIGQIFPTANDGSTFGNSALFCDGTLYPTTSFPALFGVIGYAFGGTGGAFAVPDLRAKFPVGAGGSIHGSSAPLASTGGEQAHTLVEAEIPSLAHAITPHSHTYLSPVITPSIVQAGAGIGDVPTPAGTGLANDSIANHGGGGAHENMPPWVAINFFIVTGLPQ